MAEYIKRNLAKAEFTGNFQNEYPVCQIHALIDCVPAADVRENVRGKWKREVLGSTGAYGTTVMYRCSACETLSINKSRFCPNCGADMREVQDD